MDLWYSADYWTHIVPLIWTANFTEPVQSDFITPQKAIPIGPMVCIACSETYGISSFATVVDIS